MREPRVFVFSQFLWPDDAPTGIYAEQLADAVLAAGAPVILVAGQGAYRPGNREPPRAPVEHVAHRVGGRTSLPAVAAEYESVRRSFRRSLREWVQPGDVVVISTAPPTTLFLHRAVRRTGATGIYWLQDFYPELIRGIREFPRPFLSIMRALWRAQLARWPHVVKAAGNLGYEGANTRVIRNWPTIVLGEPREPLPRTALYSGNLSYAHDLKSFLEVCERLRAEGFEITVRGDGKWIPHLPAWIRTERPLQAPQALARSYWEAEVHLVAGHPRFPTAVFPSKYWNSRATGRRIQCSGFSGPMLAELRLAEQADFAAHLPAFRDFVIGLLARRQ